MWSFFLRIVASVIFTGISAYLSYRKQEQPNPGTLEDLGNPRADEGSEIIKVFGTVNVADPQVVWFGDLGTSPIRQRIGRKYGLFGPKQYATIGFQYRAGIHFVLCLGPVDNVGRIRIDKRVLLDGLSTGGRVSANQPNLFGASDREGGAGGDIDILMGADDQPVNDYLAANTSGPTPAHRGVTSLVLRQFYIGNNPSLRPWEVRLTRISRVDPGYNGGSQWYPEKAQILRNPIGDPVPVFGVNATWEIALYGDMAPPPTPSLDADYESFVVGFVPGPFIFGDPGGPPPVDGGTFIPSSPGYWLRRAFSTAQSGLFRISGDCENSQGIYLDGVLVFNPNPDNFFGAPSGFSFDLFLSAGSHSIHVYFRDDFITGNASHRLQIDYLGRNLFDMNPAHILREVLLSPDTGGTGNEAEAGDTWETVADTLYAEGFGISIAWRGGADRADFKKEIERHIDARSFVDRRTGLWEIKLIRDDYDPEDLPVFDTSNVAAWSNISFPQPGSLLNQLVVNWNEPEKDEKTSLTISNPARIRMNASQVISEPVDYLGINRSDLAGRVAMRDLAARSAPLATGEFRAKSFPTNLNLGSVIIVNNPRLGLVNKIVRITEIDDGNIQDSSTTVRFIEDQFSIGDTSPIEIEVIPPEDTTPQAMSPRLVEEAPLYLLSELLGAENVAAALAFDEGAGFLFVASGEPTQNTFDALVFRDLGSGYEELTVLTPSFSARTLGAVSNRADRSKVVVESREALTMIAPGAKVWLSGEQLLVETVEAGDTSTPGDYWEPTETATLSVFTLTLTRGLMDTVPLRHSAGADLVFYEDFGYLEDDIQSDGDALSIKLQTRTTRGQLDLASAPIDDLVFASRASRPYPPGDLRLDGDYEAVPPIEGTSYALTWEHRDRNAGSLIGHGVAGPAIPEAGTEYRVLVQALDAAGAVLSILTDVNVGALTVYDWDESTALPDGTASLRFTVSSVRDGLESWQSPSIVTTFAAGFAILLDTLDELDPEYAILTEADETLIQE